MTLNTTKTVRELALEVPNATRVFERLKIDYCCGGGRQISEACAAAGVPLDELSRLLDEECADAAEARDFNAGPLSELIRHILDTHHVYTREESARIQALLEKVCGKHGENHPELSEVRAAFVRLDADLQPHLFKEEQILFPYILRLEAARANGGLPPFAPFGTVNNPVRMMMSEHDTAGDLLREIRAAARDFRAPDDACVSFRALYRALEDFEQDLHQHIHLENNVLFPRAVELEATAHAA
ncbi:MAG TPA: iron-sulfur cluster repair di-iron protein [Pyrinomonadaceae bacterium]|nr:iron-sulfur cluster repair di-iron protein [Pyrinomonadaceae bacterium]